MAVQEHEDVRTDRTRERSDLIGRTERLLDEAARSGVAARALGGVAVAMRCPSASEPPLKRDYHDLDLATTRADARGLSALLVAAGFQPNERFNALHGRSRLIFSGPGELHLDVLVDEFSMCHRLDLSKRLAVAERTLTLGDLLLTKLQIAELNFKDAQDLAALLLDHPLTDDETGVNAPYVAGVLARDWGWWRTVTGNLDLLDRHLPAIGLADTALRTIGERVGALREAIDGTKKSLGWRSRAKLGDRISWRNEPEEIATG